MMALIRTILPYVLGALAVSGIGYLAGQDRGSARVTKQYQQERIVWLRREVTLWSELASERATKRELIEEVEKIINATGRARQQMLAELDRTKAAASAAETRAQEAIRRLADVENSWKSERVPDAIVCVFNDTACAVTPTP
jgi:hypothetical protein